MNVYMFAIIVCLIIISISMELIRRKMLQEQYVILWISLGSIMVLFCLFPSSIDLISNSMHIYYAPSFLFLGGLLFSFALIMHLTLIISKLHRKLTRLIQEVGLLQEQLKSKEDK